MKVEVILRVQETRYTDKFDKYRCLVSEERAADVIKHYEEVMPKDVYGCWVLANRIDDNGDFVEVIQ